MTTATIEKGPTGVDLHWPRTTVNKESRWKLAQWAAIAGAAMIGADDNGRATSEHRVALHQIEHLAEVTIDDGEGIHPGGRAPTGRVPEVVGIGIMNERVIEMPGGDVGQQLALHRRGNFRREEGIDFVASVGVGRPVVAL